MVQCKHFAHSERSVGLNDLGSISDSCLQHDADGYLLACSTIVSSSVVKRLEEIGNHETIKIKTTYWDAVKIEMMLTTPNLWSVAQRFMPVSGEASGWKIYATESPNHWVAIHRGYYFHLSNRIGSHYLIHLESIDSMIDKIEAISLPNNQFIRIRSINYDDKNGAYMWCLDYMYRENDQPLTPSEIKYILGDEYAADDGQIYHFDVKLVVYNPYHDHYDHDHYSYYSKHMSSFLTGTERPKDYQDINSLESDRDDRRHKIYWKLNEKFKHLDFALLVHSDNAGFESLEYFNRHNDWSEYARSIDDDEMICFFFSRFVFRVKKENENKFLEMLLLFQDDKDYFFKILRRVDVHKSIFRENHEDDDDEDEFELFFCVRREHAQNEYESRRIMNQCFGHVITAIDTYLNFEIEK